MYSLYTQFLYRILYILTFYISIHGRYEIRNHQSQLFIRIIHNQLNLSYLGDDFFIDFEAKTFIVNAKFFPLLVCPFLKLFQLIEFYLFNELRGAIGFMHPSGKLVFNKNYKLL